MAYMPGPMVFRFASLGNTLSVHSPISEAVVCNVILRCYFAVVFVMPISSAEGGTLNTSESESHASLAVSVMRSLQLDYRHSLHARGK